ncbi:MAG: hypothetical protein E3J71_02350 [Candidatus Stahlbacteria bacterium]|nr:MAG: hypothetical protein E3J71_02350 [Candidatus Stahlbacteria bacterium]
MSDVRKLFQELSDKGLDDAIIGTVEAVQQTTPAGWALSDRIPGFWCDVQPEKESETLLQHVPMPLRVLNREDDKDLGFILVPEKNTEVLVTWVDGRPTIEACQRWERMILKKGDNLWIEIDADDNIFVQTAGAVEVKVKKTMTEEIAISKQVKCPLIKLGKTAPHPVFWGDMLMTWLSTHVHSPGGLPPILAQTAALPGILSKTVFID